MSYYKISITRIYSIVWLLLAISTYYIYVYAPPFKIIPIGLDKFFLLISIAYLSIEKKWGDLHKCFRQEKYLLGLITIISLIISLIHHKDYGLFSSDLLLTVEAIPCAYAFYIFFSKRLKSVYKIIGYASIVAGIISLFLILHPDLMQNLKENVLKYPERLVNTFVYRGYGLSDGLLFSFPVIQGFCVALVLVNIKNWNPFLAFVLIILGITSVIVNARSGFVPIAVGICVMVWKNRISALKVAIIIILCIILFGRMINSFIESNEMLSISAEWSTTTFEILSDLSEGKKTENMDVLMGDFLVWPKYIDEWLIGRGINIFSNPEFKHSDIGYIIRLNYGGIIYLFCWIALWLYMFSRLYSKNKQICIILFVSLIYLNFKGDFFVVNPASRFFFLVYIWTILENSRIHPSTLSKTQR